MQSELKFVLKKRVKKESYPKVDSSQKNIALICYLLYNINVGTTAHKGLTHFMYVE